MRAIGEWLSHDWNVTVLVLAGAIVWGLRILFGPPPGRRPRPDEMGEM